MAIDKNGKDIKKGATVGWIYTTYSGVRVKGLYTVECPARVFTAIKNLDGTRPEFYMPRNDELTIIE